MAHEMAHGIVAAVVAVDGGPGHAQVARRRVSPSRAPGRSSRRRIAEARRSKAGGVIAVVDDGGNLMALERLDGTFAAGANISIGKARTAALFKKPTRGLRGHHRQGPHRHGRASTTSRRCRAACRSWSTARSSARVGVSGAASAQQDEELAIAGAAAVDGARRRRRPAAP